MKIERNPTRPVRIGSVTIGNGHPIAVQSMTATKTQDIEATVELVNLLSDAGADVVRIAVDSKKDAAALMEIRKQTTANLSVDLQENYRLAEVVAPHVDKLRYNPGHLYHHERDKPWQSKVEYLSPGIRIVQFALESIAVVWIRLRRTNMLRMTRLVLCSKARSSIALGLMNLSLSVFVFH